jgi:hypothetical protein
MKYPGEGDDFNRYAVTRYCSRKIAYRLIHSAWLDDEKNRTVGNNAGIRHVRNLRKKNTGLKAASRYLLKERLAGFKIGTFPEPVGN